MQNYEIALIVNPDMSSDIEGFKKEFEGLLSSLDFNVVNVNDVGRRQLAYTIEDHNKGHYIFYFVEGNPENLSELESKVKFNEVIIRHLVLKLKNFSDIEFNLAVKSETTTEKATKKSSTESMKTEVKDEDPDQKDTKADATELDTSDEDESKVENQEKEKDE
ncbi:MAG: 30S ribosomal protein S6 [Pseudomonadota bacterium]|nr:30S ribosomal protein S6 [Pseudomonadota bacterium]